MAEVKTYVDDNRQPVEDREQRKFIADIDGDVAVNVVGKNIEDLLLTISSGVGITLSDLLNLTLNSGFLNGETYDKIQYGVMGPSSILSYSLEGITLFQIVITLVSQTQFSIIKRPGEFIMLQENNDNILQENGDNLLVQGLIP